MKKTILKVLALSMFVLCGGALAAKPNYVFPTAVKRASSSVTLGHLNANNGGSTIFASGSDGQYLTWTKPTTVEQKIVAWNVAKDGMVRFDVAVPASERALTKKKFVMFNNINTNPAGLWSFHMFADGIDATFSSQIQEITLTTKVYKVYSTLKFEYNAASQVSFVIKNISGAAQTLTLIPNMYFYMSSSDISDYVTYIPLNKNGGSGGPDSVAAASSSSASEVTPYKIGVPTRTGYTFLGYYDGNTKYFDANGNPTITAWPSPLPSSLTAKWEQKYTVTLNADGGSGGTASVSASYNENMPSITKPSKTGYTFNGYYTEKNGKGTKYYNSDGTSAKKWDKNANTTLYAYWTANTYTVTYNANGGTGGTASATATYGQAMPSITKPTRTGYDFAGYYDSKSGGTEYYNESGSSSRSFNKTSNTTLYARWNAKIYNNIYLDAQGGSGHTTKIMTTYDAAMPSGIVLPVRDGYVFCGYYSGTNGTGTKYYNADGTSARTWNIDKDKTTLYAYWSYNSEIQSVVDKIKAIKGPASVTYPSSKQAILDAEAAYAELITSHPEYATIISDEHDELVQDREAYDTQRQDAINNVNTLIGNMLDDQGHVIVTYPDSHDDLYGAENAFDALDEDDMTSEIIPDMDKLEDCRDEYNAQAATKIIAVEEAIDNIYRDEQGKLVYGESKESLLAAEELYNALAPEEKYPTNKVRNYADLVQAREEYNLLIQGRASEVIYAINNIDKPFGEHYKEQIEIAKDLFDALDEDEQSSNYVTNLSILEDAMAADKVVDMILALQNYESYSDKEAFVKAVDDAMNAYLSLTTSQKEYLNESQKAILFSMDDAITVIKGIDKIGDVTYDHGVEDSKAGIEYYQGLYDALGDDYKSVVDHFNKDVLDHDATVYNHVDEVANLIRAIPQASESDEYYDAVDAAKDAYDNLTQEEKTIIDAATDMDYEKYLLDHVAARDVIERIQDIMEVNYDNGDLDSLEDIEYADQGYNSLTDDQKAIVDAVNHNTLVTDREMYDHVDEVADMIRSLTPAESDEYYDAVDAAKAAYEALSDKEKHILEFALDMNYIKALNDHVESKEVIKMIEEIGDVTFDSGNNDSLKAISDAKAAYDELSSDQKAIVDTVNSATLFEDKENYDAVAETASLIKAIPEASESQAYYDAVDAAKNSYDSLTDEQKAILDAAIDFDYDKHLEDQVAAKDVIKRIDDIDEVTYAGGENDSADAIAYALEGYEALSDEQKAIVDAVNHETLVEDKKAYDAVDHVADLIRDLTPAESEEYYSALEEAKNAYDALDEEEKAILDAALDQDYEKDLADQLEAKEVIKLIEEIGKVTYDGGQEDSLKAINDAEDAYALLTDDQKAIVDEVNHDTLVEDRETYDEVDKTVKLIEDIGEVSYGGQEDSKEAIDAAREAYDSLDEEEKELVKGHKESYKALDDSEHVYEALEKIESIGEVEYDTLSEETIAEAREVYDSLSEDQKAKLGENPFGTLTAAENKFAEMKHSANVTVTIFLILSSLTLVGGLVMLFLLLFKRNDDEEEEKKENSPKSVKTYSFLGFLPILALTSHYVDSPFMALYIISGLAILVWIAVLILFLLKKNHKLPVLAMPNFKLPFQPKAVMKKDKEDNKSDYVENGTLVTSASSISPAPSTIGIADPSILIDGPIAIQPKKKTKKVEVVKKNEDEDVIIVKDEKGDLIKIRYIKSFLAKLSQASAELKDYYNELKNYVLSFEKVNSRVSFYYDAINNGRNPILRFAIRGKTLCLFMATSVEKYEGSKYKVEKTKNSRFKDYECLYRIKNERRMRYAKDLILDIMKSLNLTKTKDYHSEYRIPYEDNARLLAKGLIKERKVKIKVK